MVLVGVLRCGRTGLDPTPLDGGCGGGIGWIYSVNGI